MRRIPSARFDELDEEFYNGGEDFIAVALDLVAKAYSREGIVVS